MENTAQFTNQQDSQQGPSFGYPAFDDSTNQNNTNGSQVIPVGQNIENASSGENEKLEELKKSLGELLDNENTSNNADTQAKEYSQTVTPLSDLNNNENVANAEPQPESIENNVILPENDIVQPASMLHEVIPDVVKPKAMYRNPVQNNLSSANSFDTNDTNQDQVSNTAGGIVSAPVVVEEPVVTIDDLLMEAVNRNASDLHISVGYPPILRIDGSLVEVGERILDPETVENLIFSVLSEEKKELLEVNREIDFAYMYKGSVNARFRVNAYYTMKNLSAAFRLIPSRVRTIEELMLPPLYHQLTKLKQGLILVTGPTGHGKSTTLASMLEDINRTRFCHIVTIEDPIEYVFEGKRSLIDQREMNDDTHSWNIALRSALRQDPDVILVGEMRDYETIAATITLAETGHLVFATLHTNSASQTIDRIIDVFPENQQQQVRTQLANTLEAVIAQRLIPINKGGRRAVSEIMLNNSAIANLIREGKTHQIDNVIRTSSDVGMIYLEKSLVNLVREGAISVQKAQEYAVHPEEVLRLLKS